ncbi:hypothetical protein AB6A40_007098 [Gnathostoma spinigerum]|uniref:Uncharacterized protein n=1 Tax=Gnathostoma spinigerum TaxID=75299 RepID=A0ABD6ESW5_9BILA
MKMRTYCVLSWRRVARSIRFCMQRTDFRDFPANKESNIVEISIDVLILFQVRVFRKGPSIPYTAPQTAQ